MGYNRKCKECGTRYHNCSSCDHNGIPWESEGFCSGDCYWGWSQAEIERLRGELAGDPCPECYEHEAEANRLSHVVEQRNTEIERLRAFVAKVRRTSDEWCGITGCLEIRAALLDLDDAARAAGGE